MQHYNIQKMLQQSHLLRNQPECRKRRLFRFFHSTLEHYSFHPNLYNILLVLQILQIADYGLHESYGPLWNAPVSNGIRTALSYMDLSPIWQQGSGVTLLIFVCIWVIVNASALGLTIYEVEKDPKKLEKPNIFVIKFVTLYSVFLKSILLIPLALAFSAFTNPTSFGLSDKQQIALAVVSVLGFGLTLANLALYIYFMRDNSPFSKLPFACSVNSQEQLRSGFKLALGIYGSLSANSSAFVGEIFCAFYIMCLIFLCYYNYSRAGYVQERIGRMLELGLISGLWLGLCSFVQIQVATQAGLGFSLCVLGLIMVPFAWRSVQVKRRKQLLTSNYKMLHSSTSCLLYNYQCIRLANNIQDIQSLQYLEGILNFHIMHCKKSQELCVCLHVRTELLQFGLDKDKEQLQKQRKLWFQFIRSNLTEVREKYQKVTEIRFLLAYIQNDILMNKFRALHSLEEAREIQSGYKYQFLDYHYMKEVEKKIEVEDRANNQKKPVDINKYYNFQIGFGKLQELMEESTYQYVSFWELLRSDKVTREKLYEQGARINRKLDEVKDCFERLTIINPNNIHSLVLYSNFMKVIVNNNEPYERNLETIEAVKRTMAQSSKLHREVEKEKYGDNSISAVIIISGERSNIGIIKHCNWKIGEIIGYAPHQLLGQNINVLMPKFIGNMHDDVLRNYLELSQSQYDFTERLVPMIDAHNFMVLSRILTKPLPSLYNGLELVGIFNAVVENNINHPGESPKYVLYRSDTGQVQALSETCFDEFQYKINKIDEFNETSSELTFSTLFVGAKESDILESPGFKCKVLSKIANTSEIEEVPVEVFQRLQIYYYSVRLRLLSFYTLRSYRQMEDTINNAEETHPDQIIANQNQWEKQPKTQRSVAPQRAVKQKFLHEMSKKKGLVNSEATAFKALRAIGYVFFLMATIYSIILIVLHTRISVINDYLMLTQLSGESLGDLAETVYYARMMHLSHYFPALNNYAELQGNISVSVNSLQNSQFSIEKLYLNYGTDFVWVSQWSISNNGVISSVQATIDANIFDLVTSASSFNQDPQSTLNFPLVMTKGSNNVTTQLQQLFSIRYSSLFQSIPKKLDYDDNFATLFNKFITSQINYGLLQLGLAVGFLLLFLAVIVALSISLLKTIDQTMLLFGFMTRHQVQREIQNCNSFLEIFYQDSYLIWLKKKQKLKSQAVLNPFVADELHLKKSQRGGGTSKVLQNNASEAELTLKDSPTQQNIVKASLNKIQFLEKELHLRTEAEILISQTQQENQNQLLRGQVDSSEEDAIYDHLSRDQDSKKAQQVLIYFILVCILTGYFVFEFLLYRSHLTAMQKEIKNVRMAYSNINSLKLVRLYSLQALIDNSQFKTYPLPSIYANQSYINLYAAQREFDTVAMSDTPNYSIYYLNNCNPTSLSQLQASSKLFPSGSFSVAECKNVLQAVLVEGLRLAIVGYTETWFNLTRLSNISQVIGTTSFLQARQIQKYIEAPLKIFATDHYSKVSQIASQELQSLLLLLLLFFLVLVLLWIVIWRNNLLSLNDRLRQTRLILGFIPVRVFIRNTKLTKEYEKYIGDLME